MARGSGKPAIRVAVTGASGDLGALLLPRLEADDRVEKIVAIDVAKPPAHGAKVEYRRVDLAQPTGERDLRDVLIDARVDALYHLAFITGRVHSAAFAHELEVIGSMHVLTAAAAAELTRLIVPSMTALYGARPQAPALIREDAVLHGCPGSRFVNDKVEVELQIAEFARKNRDTAVTVLRFAPIVGPTVDNPVTRWRRTRVVPTLLGHDPLWQVIHEDDAADALHAALFAEASGAFNVVGPGVLSLSALIRLSGGAPVPLPSPVARAVIRGLEAAGLSAVPPQLLDYMNYSWVADGRRAEDDLGFVPRWESKQAALALRGA